MLEVNSKAKEDMQRMTNMTIEEMSGEPLLGVNRKGDSISESDKVTEAISQMAISSEPFNDKLHEALVKKSKIGPRWKSKGAEGKALSDPMSTTIAQLQSSLVQSNSRGILTSSGVLIDVDAYQTDILTWACFGCPYATADKDKQWFLLSMEEAFFLYYVLKCIGVVDVAENYSEKNAERLLIHMSSSRKNFVNLFSAYSHLRLKNWVVRFGSQYGVDFVAYRHHPSLVHSEYAVLVLSEDDGETNGRLRVWSDVHCTLRLCGSVAKTLLVLNIQKHGRKGESLSDLDSYTVEERIITRWSPEQAKEARIPERVS